jgi:uncharacterized protein (UPF0147 family)
LNARGEVDTAYKLFGEAQAQFEKLRASGNDNEAVTYGLALSLYNQGQSALFNGRGTTAQLNQAADLLRPLVQAPDSSRQVRQAYADTLNILSHMQPKEAAVATCQEALKILEGIGALDLSNLNAASGYADVSDSEARHLLDLGRADEAQKVESQVYDLTEKVLVQRPGDLRSLANRFFAANLLGTLAERRHDDTAAADYATRAAKAGEDYVRFNPADLNTWSWWVQGLQQVADLHFERGEVTQTLATYRSMMALAQDRRRPSSLGPITFYRWLNIAALQAMQGEKAAAQQSLQGFARDLQDLAATYAPEDPRRQVLATSPDGLRSRLLLAEGDAQGAFTGATSVINRVEQIKVEGKNPNFERTRNNNLRYSLITASTSAIRLGHAAQAETLARQLVAIPADPGSQNDTQELAYRNEAILAHAVALQGRGDETRTILQPALAYYEKEQQAGAHNTSHRRDYAYALYVDALARGSDADGRAKREAELAEAARLIAGASAEVQKLSVMRELSDLIAAARAQRG